MKITVEIVSDSGKVLFSKTMPLAPKFNEPIEWTRWQHSFMAPPIDGLDRCHTLDIKVCAIPERVILGEF